MECLNLAIIPIIDILIFNTMYSVRDVMFPGELLVNKHAQIFNIIIFAL